MTYNLMNDPNVWVIAGLVFVLGALIGMFLTAGGRRKWKARYKDEVTNRESWEREHAKLKSDYEAREADYRERDSRGGDLDGDGVPDAADRRPADDRRA